MDRKDLISDAIRELERLAGNKELWMIYEKHDDLVRELKFIASSLRNAKVNITLLVKAIDALMIREMKLAYNLLYSDTKLDTQTSMILDNKFHNQETNFFKQLKSLT